MRINPSEGISWGWWCWATPILIAISLWMMQQAKQWQTNDVHGITPLLSGRALANYVGMLLLFAFVSCFSNHDKLLHYQLSMEQHMLKHEYSAAAKVGENSLQTDSSLTCLRIYNLSLMGQLPHRLFHYPIVGGADALLPNGRSVRFFMCPMLSVGQHLGAVFKQHLSPMHYLELLHQHKMATPAAHDYLLCGYLLQGKLDAFAHTIGRYYAITASLPKHYREALVLYNHLRSAPFVLYHDNVVDADFADFQTIMHNNPDPKKRLTTLRDTFGNTYWMYYYQLHHEQL